MAAAGEAPAEPSPDGPALEKATAKIVEGTVDWREGGPGNPWQSLEVGQELTEGVDIRTGFRARCVLAIRRSLVQIDAMTLVRVAELRSQQDTVRTRLYLKQGRTESIVEKGGTKSDFAIVTPSATLSVRGTIGVKCAEWPDKGLWGVGSGSITVKNDIGTLLALADGQMTDKNFKAALQYLSELRRIKIHEQLGLTKSEFTPQFVLPGGPTTPNKVLTDKPGDDGTEEPKEPKEPVKKIEEPQEPPRGGGGFMNGDYPPAPPPEDPPPRPGGGFF
jgi:hypothetical protein